MVYTIRNVILTGYPEHAELVRWRFPADPIGEEAFAYALELYVRAIPGLDVALDGWSLLQLVQETAASLRAVGIMHVLPAGELPLEVQLSRERGATRYQLRIGIDDARWKSLSQSKRWKGVYLYATENRDEAWTWSEPIIGCLADA